MHEEAHEIVRAVDLVLEGISHNEGLHPQKSSKISVLLFMNTPAMRASMSAKGMKLGSEQR